MDWVMLCDKCKDCSRIITLTSAGLQQIVPCPECGGHRMTYCCEGESNETWEYKSPETKTESPR